MIKKDIKSREDIELLINEFYKKIMEDNFIGHFFTELVPLDWEKHIPIMYDFWESVLFGTGGYTGNPIKKHIEMNKNHPLKEEHFDRWLSIWEATILENFRGVCAEEAIQKAQSMKAIMLYKIKQSGSDHFIQ